MHSDNPGFLPLGQGQKVKLRLDGETVDLDLADPAAAQLDPALTALMQTVFGKYAYLIKGC